MNPSSSDRKPATVLRVDFKKASVLTDFFLSSNVRNLFEISFDGAYMSSSNYDFYQNSFRTFFRCNYLRGEEINLKWNNDLVPKERQFLCLTVQYTRIHKILSSVSRKKSCSLTIFQRQEDSDGTFDGPGSSDSFEAYIGIQNTTGEGWEFFPCQRQRERTNYSFPAPPSECPIFYSIPMEDIIAISKRLSRADEKKVVVSLHETETGNGIVFSDPHSSFCEPFGEIENIQGLDINFTPKIVQISERTCQEILPDNVYYVNNIFFNTLVKSSFCKDSHVHFYYQPSCYLKMVIRLGCWGESINYIVLPRETGLEATN